MLEDLLLLESVRPMNNEEQERLGFTERLGYGLGDTASNFFFQTFNIFLLYYYTDVFGLSAAAVGTMFFVTKLWDAVNDPLMGVISDRTQTRWGKFRPYLLWMAIPYGVMGCLMFAGPDFTEDGKLVYAFTLSPPASNASCNHSDGCC